MFKYLCLAIGLFWMVPAMAQTPQQLEMLKRKQQQEESGLTPQIQAERAAPKVQFSPQPPMKDGDFVITDKMLKQKTRELRGLSPDQLKAAAMQEAQDTLIVSTGNFKVYEGLGSTQICTLDIGLLNMTQYPVEEIKIFFGWGETETYGTFSGMRFNEHNKINIGLAGPVCRQITAMPVLRVETCKLKGASEGFCRSAIVYGEG